MADPLGEMDDQVKSLTDELARRKEAILRAVVDYNGLAYDAGIEAVSIRFRCSASAFEGIQFPARKEEMNLKVASLNLK